jgi:hypothetical protein
MLEKNNKVNLKKLKERNSKCNNLMIEMHIKNKNKAKIFL